VDSRKNADAYREELLELLRSKPAATPADETLTSPASTVGDLMTALRASVEAAKRRGQKKSAGSKRAG
jgi:non-homologous end joining protein Ku